MATPTIQEQIRQANELLKSLKAKVVSMGLPSIGKNVKITLGEEKGNLIISGLQRFPYSFYLNQALKMKEILNSPEFERFVEENKEKLSVKSGDQA